jgi:hypothetical protein
MGCCDSAVCRYISGCGLFVCFGVALTSWILYLQGTQHYNSFLCPAACGPDCLLDEKPAGKGYPGWCKGSDVQHGLDPDTTDLWFCHTEDPRNLVSICEDITIRYTVVINLCLALGMACSVVVVGGCYFLASLVSNRATRTAGWAYNPIATRASTTIIVVT